MFLAVMPPRNTFLSDRLTEEEQQEEESKKSARKAEKQSTSGLGSSVRPFSFWLFSSQKNF